MNYKELAINIWDRHIDVFDHFDLLCQNGCSLEDETKTNALFNALVTLEYMRSMAHKEIEYDDIINAIDYLKKSKYYSIDNKDSKY